MFHHLHRGVSTNAAPQDHLWKAFHDEYIRIRGGHYFQLTRVPELIGRFSAEAEHFARVSKQAGNVLWKKYPAMIS